MDDLLFDRIKNNIDSVLSAISASAARAGRKENDVRLMAVTKTKPFEYVSAAYEAGSRLFGENRVDELASKFENFHSDAEVHLIGHLQRNKAKEAVRYASSIDSVDRYETAEAINRYCSRYGKKIDILLEYNTSGEESKNGFRSEEEFFSALDKIRMLENLNIKGLMTIAPHTEDREEIRKAFRRLSSLLIKTDARHRDLHLRELSMGMSSDFDIAVEEGSTMIRIGTMLFGQR